MSAAPEPILPIPSGTRDVLPDETRELREITESLRAVFEGHGYGEIYTPALEYEAVLGRAGDHAARPAYRLFDEAGQVLVLRADMTVPIARVASTRYAQAEPPLRFCYFAHCYRGVRPQRGQTRELLQAGIELIGAPAPQGTAEALTVLCHALSGCGLEGFRVGLGDASLYAALLSGLGVGNEDGARLLERLVHRDFVGLAEDVGALALSGADAEVLLSVPQVRGGPDVLDDLPGPVREAAAGLHSVHALLDPEVADRLIFDFGLVASFGYYTGAVFEVYDPALGAPLGGGGRYDELLGRFGRPLPAVGFALGVDRLHLALAGEERARAQAAAGGGGAR
ncbi:MAG TPA: ATP phosphoribosyltransferase regulatory subunit [Solirubrobacteraceae bacterium]|jgi:ATP phosphoribosyltransferase regulatory subunit|nr:ATP phosphoribosyltransferase regulatory subunit [Solirubrobacteraceae bacterium]